MKITKKKYIVLFLALIVVASYSFATWSRVSLEKRVAKPFSEESSAVSFEVKPGENVRIVADGLKKSGLIGLPDDFIAYSRKTSVDKRIKSGIYTLNTNMSIKDVLKILVSGDKSEIWITIPEGWRIDQIASYLEGQGLVDSKDFIEKAKVKNFSSFPFLSGLPGNTSLEGYLFPDTYRVFSDSDVESIIKVMLDNFGRKVTAEMMDRANKLGFTLHQFVTFASIVDKESAHSEDIRMISSVYYNRLNQGMLFQSDATITYITKRPDARPTFEETKVDSPYNTYLHKGLPPGPVGNPGMEAMEASLNPEESDYLFFVSKGNRAYFAETYEGHLQNIAKYLD